VTENRFHNDATARRRRTRCRRARAGYGTPRRPGGRRNRRC